MKLLNEYITESFKKEYGYRVKFAADCGAEHMAKVESCLAKYNLVSATPFKRTPIEENPIEFMRYKGVQCTSEVCSSDIILKYPVNERILEVWLAVNLGLDHSRVLCYGVNDPRRIESDMAAERKERDEDRTVNEDDAPGYTISANTLSVNESINSLNKIKQWDAIVIASGSQEPIGLFIDCNFDDWENSLRVNFSSHVQ